VDRLRTHVGDGPKSLGHGGDPGLNASKTTLQLLLGTQNDQVLDLFRACHGAGKAIRGVLLGKMGWDKELQVADIRRVSQKTEIVCRWYIKDWADESIWF
jgi:hypothetical protein